MTFDCDADTYFEKVYLDDAYTKALYKTGLGFSSFQEVSKTVSPKGAVDRTLQLQPGSSIPGALKAILGSALDYTEVGHKPDDALTWTYTITPGAMSGSIKSSGTQTVTSLGKGKCQAVFDATFSAKVPFLGGAIEKFMAGEFDTNMSKQETFTAQWIKTNNL